MVDMCIFGCVEDANSATVQHKSEAAKLRKTEKTALASVKLSMDAVHHASGLRLCALSRQSSFFTPVFFTPNAIDGLSAVCQASRA